MDNEYFIERLSGRFKIHRKGTGSGTEQIATADSEEDATLITTALNERERLRAAIDDAIDKLDRTTSVQNRSVTLIKQSCRFVAKNLRAALNDQKGE